MELPPNLPFESVQFSDIKNMSLSVLPSVSLVSVCVL